MIAEIATIISCTVGGSLLTCYATYQLVTKTLTEKLATTLTDAMANAMAKVDEATAKGQTLASALETRANQRHTHLTEIMDNHEAAIKLALRDSISTAMGTHVPETLKGMLAVPPTAICAKCDRLVSKYETTNGVDICPNCRNK